MYTSLKYIRYDRVVAIKLTVMAFELTSLNVIK